LRNHILDYEIWFEFLARLLNNFVLSKWMGLFGKSKEKISNEERTEKLLEKAAKLDIKTERKDSCQIEKTGNFEINIKSITPIFVTNATIKLKTLLHSCQLL